MRGLTYSNNITSDVLENKTKKRENPSPWWISYEKLRPKYYIFILGLWLTFESENCEYIAKLPGISSHTQKSHQSTTGRSQHPALSKTLIIQSILNGKNHYFHIVYQSEDVKFCLCHEWNHSGYCWTGSETSLLKFYTAEHSLNCLRYCDYLAEKPWMTDKWKGGREQLVKV